MSESLPDSACPRLDSEFTGLQFLQEVLAGARAVPPMYRALAFEPSNVSAGKVHFSARPSKAHINFVGSVHGGYLVTLLDTVMGCACHTLLRADETYVTIELKANFLSAVMVTGSELRAIGKVLKRGRTIAFTEGSVFDEAENLVATSTATCLIKVSNK